MILRILQTLLPALLVGCSSTTVTRVAGNDRASYPHGKVHVGWSEYRLFSPLMIHADVELPAVGESIPAQEAFKDMWVWNCRADDRDYPEGGKNAWLREMKGSLLLISEDLILIDAYFLDPADERHSYPFAGKHKIVPSK